MSRNHVIGIRNDLPWHIPQDLEHFKNLTRSKPIIMGRLTYESILARRNGKPLPQRPHYVVSGKAPDHSLPDRVKFLTDITSAIDEAGKDYPDAEIFIIGGASIYAQSLPLVSRMYLTIIDQNIEGDAFFPDWNPSEWQQTEVEMFTEPTPFQFITLDKCRA